jgi:hypothetical protein
MDILDADATINPCKSVSLIFSDTDLHRFTRIWTCGVGSTALKSESKKNNWEIG